jgi:hypothetical protein
VRGSCRTLTGVPRLRPSNYPRNILQYFRFSRLSTNSLVPGLIAIHRRTSTYKYYLQCYLFQMPAPYQTSWYAPDRQNQEGHDEENSTQCVRGQVEESKARTRENGDHGYAGHMEHYQQRNDSDQLPEKAQAQAEQHLSQLQHQSRQFLMMINRSAVDYINTYYGYSKSTMVPRVIHPNTSPHLNMYAEDQPSHPPPSSPYYTPDAVRRTPGYQMYPLPPSQNSFTSGLNAHSSRTGPISLVSFCLKQIGVKASKGCIWTQS